MLNSSGQKGESAKLNPTSKFVTPAGASLQLVLKLYILLKPEINASTPWSMSTRSRHYFLFREDTNQVLSR